MSEKASKALIGYRAVNERMMYARYSGYPRNISVMVVYAPTMEYEEEDLEKFYEFLFVLLGLKSVSTITAI